MVRDGKRRRRTTTPPSMEGSSTERTTEDSEDRLPEDFIKFYFRNFTTEKEIQEHYKHVFKELWHIEWPHSIEMEESTKPKKEPTTTAPNSTPKNRGRGRHYEENVNPREDTSNFAEDRYSDTYKGHSHHLYPKVHPEVTQNPKNWHPVHYSREPVISFWPVGILIMAVFIVGFVSMFLCRAVTPRPRDTRRAVLSLPRASQRTSRPQRAPGAREPHVGQCRNNNDDDEGGFNDENRRRIVLPGVSSSDPPRIVTPPPPYPGTPPGGSVYVNPLDVKPEDASVSGSHNAHSSTSAITGNELPPPYPGIEP